MSRPHVKIARMSDLRVGSKLGRLLITTIASSRRFGVVCDCGRELVLTAHEIRSRKRCWAKCGLDNGPDAERRRQARYIWGRVRRAARDRDLPFSLSVEDVMRIRVGKPCGYCGGSLHEKTHGLDRRDNAEGYTAANVVACCPMCNFAKGSLLSGAEFAAAMAVRIKKVGIGHCWDGPKRFGNVRLGATSLRMLRRVTGDV